VQILCEYESLLTLPFLHQADGAVERYRQQLPLKTRYSILAERLPFPDPQGWLMLQLPSRLSQSYHANSRRMRRTHDFAVPPHEAHTRHNEMSFATSKALREDPLRYFMPLLHGKTDQLTRPASTISESVAVGSALRLGHGIEAILVIPTSAVHISDSLAQMRSLPLPSYRPPAQLGSKVSAHTPSGEFQVKVRGN